MANNMERLREIAGYVGRRRPYWRHLWVRIKLFSEEFLLSLREKKQKIFGAEILIIDAKKI